MRLAAQAKMGYYPTPEIVTRIVLGNLERKRKDGLIRILDPCAGQGTAVHAIGEKLSAEIYGIEIDQERGKKAKEILTRCLITDYRSTRISNGSFSLLYLNPPYDWSVKESEIEGTERFERTFLRDCVSYLCPGGILVYLIPQERLDSHIARMLSYRFEEVSVFRFPDKEYQRFKQIVIFGKLKKRPETDEALLSHLTACGKKEVVIPYLPEAAPQIYSVPVSPIKGAFVFRSKEIDPDELADEIERYGLFERFKELTTPLKMDERIKPIMPLRCGHLAQILACGLMNGMVWDKDGKNPLLIKGITRKDVKHTVEVCGDTEKHIETDQIKIIIQALDKSGKLLTIN